MKTAEDAIMNSAKMLDHTHRLLIGDQHFGAAGKDRSNIEEFVSLPEIKLNWKLKKCIDKPNWFDPNVAKLNENKVKKLNVDRAQQMSQTMIKEYEPWSNNKTIKTSKQLEGIGKLTPISLDFKNRTTETQNTDFNGTRLVISDSPVVEFGQRSSSKFGAKDRTIEVPHKLYLQNNGYLKTDSSHKLSHQLTSISSTKIGLRFETQTTGEYELELQANEQKIDRLLNDLEKYKGRIKRYKSSPKTNQTQIIYPNSSISHLTFYPIPSLKATATKNLTQYPSDYFKNTTFNMSVHPGYSQVVSTSRKVKKSRRTKKGSQY